MSTIDHTKDRRRYATLLNSMEFKLRKFQCSTGMGFNYYTLLTLINNKNHTNIHAPFLEPEVF